MNFKSSAATIQDRREKPARSAGKLQGNVACPKTAGTRDDVIDRPAVAAVRRYIDRRVRSSHRVWGKSRPRDLGGVCRVDAKVWLAVLICFPAQRRGDHIDDFYHRVGWD